MRNLRFPAVIATVVLTGGFIACATPQAENQPDESRYELTKDSRGRVIRLDRRTGEVVLVDNLLRRGQPPTQSGPIMRGPSPNLAVPAQQADSREQKTSAAPSPGNPNQDGESTAPTIRTAMCAAATTIHSGVTIADSPVYPGADLTVPLVTLPSGILLSVEDRSGDWIRVGLDSRWGSTTGYIHCESLRPFSP